MTDEGYSAAAGRAEALRRLHAGPRPLVLANAWDAGSARLIASLGYPAIATTSAGVAFALGRPDGETLSRDQMLEAVRRIVEAVRLPVTADMEAGFGRTAADVGDTARALAQIGAVGLNLEDAIGHRLLPVAEQIERVGAVRGAGRAAGVPLVINARTDAFADPAAGRGAHAEAVRRGNAYLEAGADCVFVPFVRDRTAIAALVREIAGPVNILAGPGSPPVPELADLGVRRVSIGSGAALAALGIARRVAEELMTQGTCETIAAWRIPYDEMQRMMGRRAPG